MDSFFGSSTVVAGHRGDPASFPDNSLSGILSGLGATGAVEVDVRMTGDGRLVLCHDGVVGGHVVAETAWPTLAQDVVVDGHRLCLLDEAMGIPGRFDLEVKNLPGDEHFDPESARLALLVAARARPSDIITSFYWPDMDRVHHQSPELTTGLLVDEQGPVLDALDHSVEVGHRVLAPHESLVTPDLVVRAAAAGIRVVAWTVNAVDRARELSQLGVAAIISDHPKTISSGLREHTR